MNQIVPSLFTILSVELSCCPRNAFSAPFKAYEELGKSPPAPEANAGTAQPTSESLLEFMVRSIPHKTGLSRPHVLLKRSINWNNVIPNRPAFAKIVVEGSIGFGFAFVIAIALWCLLSELVGRLKGVNARGKRLLAQNFFLRQVQEEKEAARKKLMEEKEGSTKTGKTVVNDAPVDLRWKDFSIKVAKSKAVQKHIGKIKKAAKSKAVQKHVSKIKKAANSKAVKKHIGKIKKAAKSKAVQKHVRKIKKAANSKTVQKHIGKIKKAAKSKNVQKHIGKVKKAVASKVKNKKEEKSKNEKSSKKKKEGETKSKKSSHKKVKHRKSEEDSEDSD
ncbi:axoneme-associated protein mst101(2)-like [Podarcis raffonei]|uniref:axoneme-associated protein mst101(2)-like n=1 Tax=Podarcis raffonei TaxID=65483 RepID=UPI0023290ED1|nr:axoneme-associated protein mst101(2)-like [Podarcis raffonei]